MLFIKYFLFFIFSIFPLLFYAQETAMTSPKMSHLTRLEGGTSVGGSGSVYFFTYNGGSHFQVAHGVRVNSYSAVLAALGLEVYETGTLLPLTIQADRNFGKRGRQLLKVHGGYAFEFSNHADTNYRQQGGLAAGMEYGWYLFKKPKLGLFTTVGYRFRRSVLVYQPFANSPEIKNNTNNHFISLNAGIEF